jgi:hypothetical protein
MGVNIMNTKVEITKHYKVSIPLYGDGRCVLIDIVFENGLFKECKLPPSILEGNQLSWNNIQIVADMIEMFKEKERKLNEAK